MLNLKKTIENYLNLYIHNFTLQFFHLYKFKTLRTRDIY